MCQKWGLQKQTNTTHEKWYCVLFFVIIIFGDVSNWTHIMCQYLRVYTGFFWSMWRVSDSRAKKSNIINILYIYLHHTQVALKVFAMCFRRNRVVGWKIQILKITCNNFLEMKWMELRSTKKSRHVWKWFSSVQFSLPPQTLTDKDRDQRAPTSDFSSYEIWNSKKYDNINLFRKVIIYIDDTYTIKWLRVYSWVLWHASMENFIYM